MSDRAVSVNGPNVSAAIAQMDSPANGTSSTITELMSGS